MAFVYENKELAHCRTRLAFQLLDECVKICHILPTEFVNQGAQKAWFCLRELAHQIPSAAGALHSFAGLVKYAFNLLVELIAVGNDGHAGVGVVFQDPFRQQYHDDAFAASLRMPNDAAFTPLGKLLCRLNAEILVYARQLFHAAVKQYKIIHNFQQAFFIAQFQQILVQGQAAVVGLVFFPFEEELLRRANGAVTQTFRIVACANKLYCRKEVTDKFLLLVDKALPNAVADRHGTAFELQHANGNAVHVQHKVGPLFPVAEDGHFLS